VTVASVAAGAGAECAPGAPLGRFRAARNFTIRRTGTAAPLPCRTLCQSMSGASSMKNAAAFAELAQRWRWFCPLRLHTQIQEHDLTVCPRMPGFHRLGFCGDRKQFTSERPPYCTLRPRLPDGSARRQMGSARTRGRGTLCAHQLAVGPTSSPPNNRWRGIAAAPNKSEHALALVSGSSEE